MKQSTKIKLSANNVGDEDEVYDGRRARSERSRTKIAQAVVKLVQSGVIQPDAQDVADLASVSLRTVYRHFEDSESLLKEIAQACEVMSLESFMAPYEATEWKGRIHEHLLRRISFYENVKFLRVSTEVGRFRSDFLMQGHKRNIRLERTSVESLIPTDLKQDNALTEALDILMSFATFQHLRLESGYSLAKTRDIIVQMVQEKLAAYSE